MPIRSATKVGLLVILSLGLFVFISLWLVGGLRGKGKTLYVDFLNVENLEKGALVRMAGVTVGHVEDVFLTGPPKNLARVEIRLNPGAEVPEGSTFAIGSPGLVGEKYINIIPRRGSAKFLPDKAQVRGVEPMGLENLLSNASQLVNTLNQIGKEVQGITDSLRTFVTDPQIRSDLRQTVDNLEAATRAGRNIFGEFQNFALKNRPKVEKFITSSTQAMQGLSDLTNTLAELAKEPNIRTNLRQTIVNLQNASKRLDQSMAQVNEMVVELKKITQDPHLRANLEKIVDNLVATSEETKATTTQFRLAAEQARQAMEDINRTVGRLTGRRKPSGESAPESPTIAQSLTTVEARQAFDPGRLSVDVNRYQKIHREQFLLFGLRDIGETTRVNLQLGQHLDPLWNWRYGFYSSRLGVGLDYNLYGSNGLSLNLYRPRRPVLDIYGRKSLGDDTSLIYGIEGLFRTNNPTLGIQLRR